MNLPLEKLFWLPSKGNYSLSILPMANIMAPDYAQILGIRRTYCTPLLNLFNVFNLFFLQFPLCVLAPSLQELHRCAQNFLFKKRNKNAEIYHFNVLKFPNFTNDNPSDSI